MARRQRNLVVQHLENLSRRALEDYQDLITDYVRRRPGIYAMYRGTRLYYVGLTRNLRARLRHHLRDRHAQSWDRFSIYLTREDEHLRELEALILRTVRPKGNKVKGKFAKSQDLRRQFRRDVAASLRIELDVLFGGGTPKVETARPERREGRTPVLAEYVSRRFSIRIRYKGVEYRATVRSDGTIWFKKKVYTSPSLAAAAVTGRPMNGWWWWKYERAPGDWVRLDELRDRRR